MSTRSLPLHADIVHIDLCWLPMEYFNSSWHECIWTISWHFLKPERHIPNWCDTSWRYNLILASILHWLNVKLYPIWSITRVKSYILQNSRNHKRNPLLFATLLGQCLLKIWVQLCMICADAKPKTGKRSTWPVRDVYCIETSRTTDATKEPDHSCHYCLFQDHNDPACWTRMTVIAKLAVFFFDSRQMN